MPCQLISLLLAAAVAPPSQPAGDLSDLNSVD